MQLYRHNATLGNKLRLKTGQMMSFSAHEKVLLSALLEVHNKLASDKKIG